MVKASAPQQPIQQFPHWEEKSTSKIRLSPKIKDSPSGWPRNLSRAEKTAAHEERNPYSVVIFGQIELTRADEEKISKALDRKSGSLSVGADRRVAPKKKHVLVEREDVYVDRHARDFGQ